MAPAVWFLLEQMQSPEREGEKKNKKERNPPAGHHFHWQLVNKLKKRDAGTIPPLPPPTFFLSLLSSSLVADTTGAFPKKKKKIFLEVMDFSGAGIGGRDISLRGCPQRWFSPPFNSIHTFWPPCSPLPQYIDVFIGMEKGISRDRLAECFCFLDLIQWCAPCQDTEQKCNFSCWMWEEKLKKLKGIFYKRGLEMWCITINILHLNRSSFFSEIWILVLQALKRSWIHLDREFQAVSTETYLNNSGGLRMIEGQSQKKFKRAPHVPGGAPAHRKSWFRPIYSEEERALNHVLSTGRAP